MILLRKKQCLGLSISLRMVFLVEECHIFGIHVSRFFFAFRDFLENREQSLSVNWFRDLNSSGNNSL